MNTAARAIAALISPTMLGVAAAQPLPPAPIPPAPIPPAQPSTAQPAAPGVHKTAENNALADEITPELDAAVTRGMAALASSQNPDGSFGDGRWGRSVAITALACIGFMSDGHLPDRGAYAPQVRRGLEFVLANCTESGLISADAANGPMYGHGFATLFLAEVYGMTAGGAGTDSLSARVHEALVKAVRLIVTTQNPEGGWRYNPVPNDADVSVTICQVMALRSARNAGIEVPKETIDKAVQYVKNCQNPDGGFRYQAQIGVSQWPRSAAGVATMQYAGIYDDPAIDRGLAYLADQAMPGKPDRETHHYFYGMYYTVQATYLAGGKSWATWWPAIRAELITSQQADGTWADPSVGNAYGTSMALIVLQMPKRYLPIFQK